VPVSGREQLIEAQHLFSVKGKRGLTDDHLWLSVVTRPARSRFTRIQRLSCYYYYYYYYIHTAPVVLPQSSVHSYARQRHVLRNSRRQLSEWF